MSKITPQEYVEGVNSIHIEQPVYEKGHDGSDGKCDCIGMCRGGLIRKGVTNVKNMGGTNEAARKAIVNLAKIKKADQLRLGDVVLKTRDKDDADYPLPDKYRKGEAAYDPDVGEINFTHIGTVTQATPLRITHMTSPTSKVDTKLGKWSWFGSLPWVEDGQPEEDPHVAYVYADSGKTVKMRAKASTLCRLYWEVPIGSSVVVMERGEKWSQIIWAGRTGYMLNKFLIMSEPAEDTDCLLIIPGLTRARAEELQKQFPGSYIETERG